MPYLAEREQFGTKLARFQAIKHQLANIALEIEPCRAFDMLASPIGATSAFVSFASKALIRRRGAAYQRLIQPIKRCCL
jgi:alkylation response protein AidB-like acyl-CoA dehydrogenase